MADLTSTAQVKAALAAPVREPKRPAADMKTDELRRAASAYEAFYLSQALQPIFASVNVETPFGGGLGEEIWRSMLVDEYGKAIVKAGGIRLADTIVRQLLSIQEHAQQRKEETR